MDVALVKVVLSIVESGFKIFSEKQRTKYMREYGEILQEIADHENKDYPDYVGGDLDLLNERLRIFLQAYGSELRKATVVAMRHQEKSSGT